MRCAGSHAALRRAEVPAADVRGQRADLAGQGAQARRDVGVVLRAGTIRSSLVTGRIAGVPRGVPADDHRRPGHRVGVVEQAAERVRARAHVQPHRAGGARAEPVHLRVDGAVGRIDEVDLTAFRGRVVDLERVPAGRGQVPAAAAAAVGDGDEVRRAGRCRRRRPGVPRTAARAALSAARRTLAPIRYGSDEFGNARIDTPGCAGIAQIPCSPNVHPLFPPLASGRCVVPLASGRCEPAPFGSRGLPGYAPFYGARVPGAAVVLGCAGQ